MSNRYTRTGFTVRETETIRNCIRKMNTVLQRRLKKQDDPESLSELRFAIENAEAALLLAKLWVSE